MISPASTKQKSNGWLQVLRIAILNRHSSSLDRAITVLKPNLITVTSALIAYTKRPAGFEL